MLHHARTLDSSKISEMAQTPVFRVTDKTHLNVLKDYTDSEKAQLSKVILAPIVGLSYLQKHLDEYDVYLVDYTEDRRYWHVYAFNKKLGLASSSHQALLTSFKRHTEKSFYEMYAEKHQ